MVKIGSYNRLTVLKQVTFGVYLDGGGVEILLPKRYVPENCEVSDQIDVFVYIDSEDRLIATTDKPYAKVGECAYLKVVSVTKIGAFLDWGLMKDLFVPMNEQIRPMEVGRSYVVHIYIDHETDRIAASAKLRDFLTETSAYHKPGQAVDLLISSRTDLGYKAIINHTHFGVLYQNEIFQKIRVGQRVSGYIKHIREDHKIDLSLQQPSHKERDKLMDQILVGLKKQNGRSTITDKSPPETIYQHFAVSKASYKKALGRLYRQRLIDIQKEAIYLVEPNET